MVIISVQMFSNKKYVMNINKFTFGLLESGQIMVIFSVLDFFNFTYSIKWFHYTNLPTLYFLLKISKHKNEFGVITIHLKYLKIFF